jgi:hypothetical protein
MMISSKARGKRQPVLGRRLYRSAVLGAIAMAVAACGSGDASTGGGAGDQPWLHVTPTWASLYDGYFGPSGAASCTGGSTCHSSAGQTGVTASNFICPDKDGCYASLMGASHLVRMQDAMDAGATPFLGKLRQVSGTGKMPSNSSFVFQPQDIDVIKAWITKGAKND